MYEFIKGDLQDCKIGYQTCFYHPYYVRVDNIGDFGDEFLASMRKNVNDIADEIVRKTIGDEFGFDKCQSVIHAMSDKSINATFVAFEDELAAGELFSSLSWVERNRALDFAIPRFDGRAQLNHRLVCQFFVERTAHDELVKRGMDDAKAWDKANGLFDKMAHDELERRTYRVDERLKYDKIWDVFFYVKCAVEVFG